ncbi:hypothetical protein ACFU7T_12130 [Streptomyces sp. NPDC057555]|uniref:hypothetical protein n=1 Tax=Streptomyces sp. NPDC057555 TaxID=3346166 RepID=UPI00368A5693
MDIAVDFVNALRRIGLDFENIGVVQDASRGRVAYEYVIDLGVIRIQDAKQMTQGVNSCMDELQKSRENAATEPAEGAAETGTGSAQDTLPHVPPMDPRRLESPPGPLPNE